MFDPLFQRAASLWETIIDFVQTAGDPIATALETYTAQQLIRHPQLDASQRKLLTHRFVVEGKIKDRSLLAYFLEQQPALTHRDRELVRSWERSFVGLLAIVQVFPQGLEVMNWLTAKHYRLQFADAASLDAIKRLQVGDIILAQISPIHDIDWLITSPWISLGRLGKPKIAVAVGSFRQNYPHYLYPDAPELLAAAWESVTTYHDQFVTFFGSEEITLPGHQLQDKISEFQTWMIDRRLEAAGVDKSKSLAELAQAAGIEPGDGSNWNDTASGVNRPNSQEQPETIAKMVTPAVELPAHLRQSPAVTALSHPHWGQMFLPHYSQIRHLLTHLDTQPLTPESISLFQKCLADPSMNSFVWRRLAQEFPQQLQIVIQQVYAEPTFNLFTDLDRLLTKFNKYLEPDLPDLASVPIHLHNLFQDAFLAVSKDKAKPKSPSKKSGFAAKS
jgi:hypothetical protein